MIDPKDFPYIQEFLQELRKTKSGDQGAISIILNRISAGTVPWAIAALNILGWQMRGAFISDVIVPACDLALRMSPEEQ